MTTGEDHCPLEYKRGPITEHIPLFYNTQITFLFPSHSIPSFAYSRKDDLWQEFYCGWFHSLWFCSPSCSCILPKRRCHLLGTSMYRAYHVMVLSHDLYSLYDRILQTRKVLKKALQNTAMTARMY